MKLYVGNLSYNTVEDTLRQLFSNYGEVLSVSIMKDKFTEASKGFGFVEMSDETYERAIGGMNGKDVDGRRIRVSEAVEKPRHGGGARKFFKRGDDDRSQRRSDFDGERRFGKKRSFDRNPASKRDDNHFEKSGFQKRDDSIPSNEY